MVSCKKCLSEKVVKNGIIRRKQRYICRECGHIFTEGDKRTNDGIIAKKAMCTILYLLGKASFNMLAHVFDTWPSLIYRWIVEAGTKLPDTEVSGEIKEMEFDEMAAFVGSKKTSFGSSKPLIVAHGELWPGCLGIVILQPSADSTTKSNT
jgi:transposase-like protein